MNPERELLEEITRARTEWMNASTIQENADADDVASGIEINICSGRKLS